MFVRRMAILILLALFSGCDEGADVPPPIGCRSGADCAEGERCDVTTHSCVDDDTPAGDAIPTENDADLDAEVTVDMSGTEDGGTSMDAQQPAPDGEPVNTCSDGQRNGNETDVDCGGDCDPCAVGSACEFDDDCEESLCIGGRCTTGACRTHQDCDLRTEVCSEGACAEKPCRLQVFILDSRGNSYERVALAGDFTNWRDGAIEMDAVGDGRWVGRVELDDGEYLYKFMAWEMGVDEPIWLEDGANPERVEDGQGGFNSIHRVDCGGGACEPVDEICNGFDDDCDESTDEAVLNACGECGAVPPEACNRVDDDCDGEIDEMLLNECGECGALPVEVCDGEDNDCDTRTDEGVLNACGACGDVPVEICDAQDNDCDTRTDEGVSNACGGCGDVPAEVCDERDNDCDGRVDEVDANGDGVSDCECLPSNNGVERCDEVDNDCDGRADEDVLNDCGGCGDVPEEICDGADNDCDGQTDEGVLNACGQCGMAGAEICDGMDNDCDGRTDEGGDLCPDVPNGQLTCSNGACGALQCEGEFGDADNDPANGCECEQLSARELCSGVDDDCDGFVDEGDNFCNLRNAEASCQMGDCVINGCEPGFGDADGAVENGCECETQNGGNEACNQVDDDCDGQVDEGACEDQIDYCRLQFPDEWLATVGDDGLDVFGVVYEAGITDQPDVDEDGFADNGRVNEDARIRVEVGYGPNGSNPDGNGQWNWFEAEANPDWDGLAAENGNNQDPNNANNDEYVGGFDTPAVAGDYDLAVRVSFANGAWTYCDRGPEGSANGYSPADAGRLLVEAEPDPGGVATPRADELAITEIMSNPDGFPDDCCEWFEVLNVTDVALDLNGVTFAHNRDESFAVANLVIQPGEYLVFARNGDDSVQADGTRLNGGIEADHVYGDDFVLRSTGTMTITNANGLAIGSFPWDRSNGASWQADGARDLLIVDVNNVRWCEASQPYGDARNRGTPGAENSPCP